MKQWEVMKAHEEGADIEIRNRNKDRARNIDQTIWTKALNPSWNWRACEYRVKLKVEIDWSKVPTGTEVVVWGKDESNGCVLKFITFLDEEKLQYRFVTFSDQSEMYIASWRHCKLVEEPRKEWLIES